MNSTVRLLALIARRRLALLTATGLLSRVPSAAWYWVTVRPRSDALHVHGGSGGPPQCRYRKSGGSIFELKILTSP
eukprot:3795358-Prymnesium_polylepis.1